MRELSAALLGATGAVGQRYLTLLAKHPFIRLEVLMGGSSAGESYGKAARWLQAEGIPEEFAGKKISASTPESARGCDLVFSALPSDAAAELEPEFAAAGFEVISEASAHRMDRDVPLMIPEVNAGHLAILDVQKRRRNWKGSLVTTPNCTATGLVIVMKPLLDDFRLRRAIVTSMQAISGAGFPGVPSLLITENVIPYIKNEEEKVAAESKKILGTLAKGSIADPEMELAISCNRVPVIDGHMETLYGEFPKAINSKEVSDSLGSFRGPPQKLRLPSAPDWPIIVREEPDRPQPRLDRLSGSVPGMSVVVGRVRKGIGRNSVQLTLLSHNTIRGAAGTAILTAELMEKEGYLGR
ncbi:MAG: aspartate-semialdehyde dehydrogenase [Nitrososphaerota archaeon]|nr:aspartate-semialdehyde dehydrogenase [Nitrososphaerota archaeon]